MASSLSVGGLGSGIDVSGIVSQLMEIERQPLKALDTKEASVQARISAFGSIKSSLSTLQNAIAGAQKGKAKAGTPEYRAALRDGLEKTSKLVGTNGVYSMAAGDHAGYDASAIVMIKVENNHWKLVK